MLMRASWSNAGSCWLRSLRPWMSYRVKVLGCVERGVWIGHLAHEALLRREVIRHVVLQERNEARGLAAVSREHRVEFGEELHVFGCKEQCPIYP